MGFGSYVYIIRHDSAVKIMVNIDRCARRYHCTRHQVCVYRNTAGVYKIPDHLACIKLRNLAGCLQLTANYNSRLRHIDHGGAGTIHVDYHSSVVAGAEAINLRIFSIAAPSLAISLISFLSCPA